MADLEEKERFIDLRAKGLSYGAIAKEMKRSKQTLINWGAELDNEIANRRALELEALYEKHYLLKEAKIAKFGEILQKITNELSKRDFKTVSTGRLLELYLLYFDKLSSEVVEPTFKSENQMEEETAERFLIDKLTAESHLKKVI